MDVILQFKEYIEREQWLKAKSLIENRQLSLSTDEEVLEKVGLVYLKLYHFNLSEDIFLKLSRMNPKKIDYQIKLAEVYLEKGLYPKAENCIRKALELDPDTLQGNQLLYRLQKETGQPFDALISQLEKIMELESSEEIHYEMAALLYENNSFKECIEACGRILRRWRRGELAQKTRELYNFAQKKLEDKKEKEDEKRHRLKEIHKEEGERKEKQVGKAAKRQKEEKSIELPGELKALEKFVGMEDVKQQILQIYNMIKFERKRREQLGVAATINKGNHFVITGNPGTGKTTVSRALCQIFAGMGLIKENKLIEADRKTLVGQYIGETEKKTQAKIEEAMGGVLFIDEAYTLYRPDSSKDFGREAIEVLLNEMENRRGEFIVIVAGYKKEMDTFFESNPGLKSRFNYYIHIPDYTDEELIKIAENIAYEQYYLISDAGKKALLERIHRERADENFGNARLVRTLVEEGIQNFANRMIQDRMDGLLREELIILDAIDFNAEQNKSPEEEIQQALGELNNLIGLKEVKEQVNSVINRIQVHQQRKEAGLKCIEPALHMMFLGNPGTGKTTVAKIIGRIYKALGVLKRGDRFVECTRQDFVSNHVGETALKTQKLIRSALGGILFIDEAYSLYQGDKDSFGKEAIDLLIKEMEDKRDNLMVIMAGYKKEMEELLSSNPGFKSRVNTIINFEDYSKVELLEIFKKMCLSSDMTIDEKGLEKLGQYIENLLSRKEVGFGNGREVRNIFEKVLEAQNNRIAKLLAENHSLSKEVLMKIEVEDILSLY